MLAAALTGGEAPGTSPASGRALAFTLPDTAGNAFRLTDALEDGPALLYFSMGVGCDGCFAQIPEVADTLAARGVRLVPIMVDPGPAVAREAARFGIASPIVIDADRAVSEAYGMLGVYGHTDRPSHSFALVRADGTLAAVRHYTTMFVPAGQLVGDLGLGAAGS